MTRPSRDGRPAQMSLSELRLVYEESINSGADSSYRKRRWSRAAEFAGWIAQDALASLETKNALRLYRSSGGREAAAFSSVPIEELRDSLDFLLYDTIKLEGRVDECISPDGAYKLDGAGREFVSWLLCLRDPALLGVWNTSAERMLKRIGAYPDSMNRGPMGIRYLDLMEALARVGAQLGLRDFIELDILAHLSTRARGRQRKSAERENSELNNALA